MKLYKIEFNEEQKSQRRSLKKNYFFDYNTILSLLVALISFIGSKWSIYTFNNFFVSLAQRFQRNRKLGEKDWIDRRFFQFLKNIDITKTIIIFFMYYLLPPLIIADYIEIDDQQKFWRSGGVNEDIILIILTNAVAQMIFSIIDVQYAWQLIKIIYYKYFNKQSNLTQFEANQLYLKELDFHQKTIELIIFVGICTFHGYLLPICYPITLISILIIYWLNKYQLIHNGNYRKIIVNGRLNKFIIIFTFIMQLRSHLVIIFANQNFYFHPVFGSLNLAITLVLIYIFYFKRNWIFPERSQTHQTNIDNINSPVHNYLYCQYNPVLNEKNFQDCPKGEERQYILKKGAQIRSTKQEQFYNSLQVKLLRELEQTERQNAQVQPSLY
ncbi:unnamed protein product [Paramecium sonneborni]|uniref:Transmembrane protein n=1 Tax=Paramecium sonneborni TaxID=65129 RepID=A0A8S1K8I9_9CILI|nr:unnamed protein product [Paramecium sonneborni]